MSRFYVSACLAAVLAACGDPVADGAYPGEPLFRIRGHIEGDAGTSSLHAPYLGLVWFEASLAYDPTEPKMVTSLVRVAETSFPGDFHMEIFEPPPAFDDSATLLGNRMVVGYVFAIDDVNDDGRFGFDLYGRIDPPDRIFGMGYEELVWIEEPGNPLCFPGLFTNPDAVAARRLLVTSVDPCRGLEVLPEDATIRLVLFPPSGTFPDQLPGQVIDDDCSDVVYPDCALEPDDPVCRMGALYEACFETRCGAAQEAYDRCILERCDGNPDELCGLLECGAETGDLEACGSDTGPCSTERVCGV